MPALLILGLLAATLTACAAPREEAALLGKAGGLSPAEIEAGPFVLYSMAPAHWVKEAPLTVYVEGDGLAWLHNNTLSDDPTPRDPIALRLAARDGSANVIYVARPCQYVKGASRRNCQPAYWSTARYHPSVVAALNAVVDRYKALSGASGVRLYGFSGGGALALLAAARRSDVVEVVTVAAVLDTDAWTRMLGDSPLSESLNPANFAQALAHIPQRHYQGAEDQMVPAAVAQSYLARFPADSRPRVEFIAGQGHDCCWADIWPLAGAGR